MKELDELKRELLANPETRAAYDAQAAEFQKVRERAATRTTTEGNNMQPTTTGDAWRYCSNLGDPEAVHALVQAALTAERTIAYVRSNTNPAELPSAADWETVLRELRAALHAVGHPAGAE